ncbi:Lipin-like protein [Globisporangium polare]
MEQSSVAQQLSAKTVETYDDHDDFDLFGAGPMSAARTNGAAMSAQVEPVIAQMQPASAEPTPPSNYELFPMATGQLEGMEIEKVQALETKEGPMLVARATAPADEGGAEDHDFVLFPTGDVVKTLVASESAVTDTSDYSMYSGSSSFSRSNSTPAAVFAAPAPLSPSYKVSGNAVDVIAVRSTEDQYFTTPWHVRSWK